MGADISDVGHPNPVRRDHIELLLHVIRRCHRWLAITLSMPTPIAGLGTQSFIAHQAVDTMLAAALAQITQVVGNLAITIDAATFQPGLLDQPQQPLILPLPRRDWRCAPGIVAAGCTSIIRHMPRTECWPSWPLMNAYLTGILWQSTPRPFLGCRVPRLHASARP